MNHSNKPVFRQLLRWLGLALLVLVTVLLYNTFRAKPWPVMAADKEPFPLTDSAISHMCQAVRIPTISLSDSSAIDTAAFDAFGSFIGKAYPLLHRRLTETRIGGYSYIFEWKGRDSSLSPVICMGHYDVVPVEAAAAGMWTYPPFSGLVRDSCIWGRGSVDDKSGVISTLEAVEALLRKGFAPRRTIYICLGHDEEIRGRSAEAAVQWLERKKVRAEMVLDEGGEITSTKLEGVHRPVAVIGVAEKGYLSFELSVQKEGGHSSEPAAETAIDILCGALYRLRSGTPPSSLTPPVKELLTRIGPSSDNFLDRVALGNMWLFEAPLKKLLSIHPEGSAILHTTIVPTILESGVKDNVIPSMASAIVNCRLLPGETSASVESYIRASIADDRVKVVRSGKLGSEATAVTSTQSPAFKRVESAVCRTVPDVIPAPYLMVGGTDSRYYRRISDGVVNFLPRTDSKGFHGVNERLPLRDLRRGIQFMTILLEETDKEFR